MKQKISCCSFTEPKPEGYLIQSVWVLTKEYNNYDQYGEYFVAVFPTIPHHTELTKHEVPQNRLRHVLNGGGRVEWEDEWFFLREVKFGE